MGNQFQTFIALFYSIDYLYEKCPCDTTALCAGELDPFLFRVIGSADPAHYSEFCEAFTKRFANGHVGIEDAFSFAKEYANKLSKMFKAMFPEDETIASLFEKHIDERVWSDIWSRAENAAEQRLAELSEK